MIKYKFLKPFIIKQRENENKSNEEKKRKPTINNEFGISIYLYFRRVR